MFRSKKRPTIRTLQFLSWTISRTLSGTLSDPKVGAYWEPSPELEWEVVSGNPWQRNERGTWEVLLENLVGNNWKPYQETYQQSLGTPDPEGTLSWTQNWQPSWAGSLLWTTLGTEREFFQHLLLGTVSGTHSAIWKPYRRPYREPCQQPQLRSPASELCWENLKPRTLHWDPIGNPVRNLETPIRNLGNLKPETRNRELIRNHPAESCPDMPQNIYERLKTPSFEPLGKKYEKVKGKVPMGSYGHFDPISHSSKRFWQRRTPWVKTAEISMRSETQGFFPVLIQESLHIYWFEGLSFFYNVCHSHWLPWQNHASTKKIEICHASWQKNVKSLWAKKRSPSTKSTEWTSFDS